MCYSAKVRQDYHDFERIYGAVVDIKEFVRLYHNASGRRITKAMDASFKDPQTAAEREILQIIEVRNRTNAATWQQELFKQRKRLADAERSLQAKATKKAENERRIAAGKVEQLKGWLAAIDRRELLPEDSRIYPMTYAPVMIWQEGRRVVLPMRYHCRPQGKPAFCDSKYPGCYNARRDNLEGFWKEQFGFSHGVVVASAFYENVSRHRLEQRELAPGEKDENVILEFKPQGAGDMLVACVWSRWTSPGQEDLLSFAAITDEPPPEVSAAGHDRCIIPIREQNLDAWLRPDGDRAKAYAVLDDRERPYYEHRLAA
jgi:putative SOS response-associated peptidase YedK